MNSEDMARTMALTYYNADCITTFKDWGDKELKELVTEISELSLMGPIHLTNYDKGFWNAVTRNMKMVYLECDNDNVFTIKGISKNYSPLFLMAVMEYGVNRLSGNQIEDKAGFEHLKLAKSLSKKDDESLERI